MNPIAQKNIDLLARSLSAVWHPCSQMKHYETFPLLPISRGKGVWLYDYDGKRYLDAVSSWWVNLFGHCNASINAALRDQLDKLEHVMLAGFTHEPVVQLSERLRALAPAGLGHCSYGSDGASAIEIALKMSAHYWRNTGQPLKTQFISLQNSYHGETLGALSITDVALFRDAYGPLIRQQATVISPDSRNAQSGESSEQYALRCADDLAQHLRQHREQLAALILEPLVQGAAGMAMYHPVYLKRASELCKEYGVHLIADEIAVGMGRTGTMFACEQADITPDFLCLSKGITGGYLPLSVVMTTDSVFHAFYADDTARGFLHSHSYTGNPLACRKAQYLNEAAQSLRAHPAVKNWRNTGMIWAFEVESPHADFAQRCYKLALQKELLLRPIGKTIYFMPPYVITEPEMDYLLRTTLELVEQLS
jgi:adenosylmethionine-8-amino-7-oxononanoate aminotransferase